MGLFQRVGAVGDDDTVHISLLGQCRHTFGQGQQVVVGQAFRRDLEHLFTLDVGHSRQLRQTGDQLFHTDLGSGIGGAIDGRGSRTSDGAAGGEDHDIGFCCLGRSHGGAQGERKAAQHLVKFDTHGKS